MDGIARRLAQSVSLRLGAPVVVENKTGASGTIGSAEVARAKPDGYTLLFSTDGPLITALATMKSLPYDPRKDFTYLAKVASNGPVLVAHPSVGANSLKELVEELKASGKSMIYGSWGPRTLPVQVMHSAAAQAGVIQRRLRGSPPALQDVLGDHIKLTFTAPHLAAPLVTDGKLKALAVVGSNRSDVLPAVQTFEEQGLKGFVFTNETWVGLMGPAGLGSAVRQKLGGGRARRDAGAGVQILGGFRLQRRKGRFGEFAREYHAAVEVIPKLIREAGVVPE